MEYYLQLVKRSVFMEVPLGDWDSGDNYNIQLPKIGE